MLLEFTVRNYRSIAQAQTLSMVAGKGGKHPKSAETGNSFAPYALLSACILGPNASGKTTLVRAFSFFQSFVGSSAKDRMEGDKIPIVPFKLDAEMRSQPTEFEAVFVEKSALYQYGFSVDEKRVWAEWLYCRPNTSGTRVREYFRREYDPKSKTYTWNISETFVRGEREVWKAATRDNALFLSTAILLNSKSLRAPFHWITRCIRTILSPERLSQRYTARKCLDVEWQKNVIEFLRSADLHIKDIRIKEEPLDLPENAREIFSEEALKSLLDANTIEYDVATVHLDALGNEVVFDLSDESAGTNVLFSLAGPFIDVLSRGCTLIIDELNRSLHPLALRHLVELFYNTELNPHGSQLIFTTHDASVLDGGIMNRDQIWLVEKNPDESTHLFPLSDFSVREGAPFYRSYLSGKFGAVPRIREFDRGQK